MRSLETSITQVLPFGRDAALRRRFKEVDREVPGNLRFGLTLEVLDKLAEEAALAYVRRAQPDARVVTAAIDGIRVRSPADVGRDLLFLARVNYVGRTSLEIGIRVEQDGDPPRHIASCYFTMVARLGDSSVPIEPLEYADELEERRRARAVARREGIRATERAALEQPTRDEFDFFLRLRREREAAGKNARLVRDLVATAWEQVYPEHENVPQKIFGGHLIHRAYQLAAIHAGQLASHRAVVAAVNRINFLRPVGIGDTLRYLSRIVYTGRTSIAVETKIERIAQGKILDLSNDCVFTFVNVDHELRPQPVPAVYPTTYKEDARYLAAYRRNRAHAEAKAAATDVLSSIAP
jgi:acyl-coenzyme A thioesterase 9